MIIGICGGSGSGKSTLAAETAKLFDDALVLSLDAFYKRADGGEKERAEKNYDTPEALDVPLLCDALYALSHGLPFDLPIYDFALHDRVGEGKHTLPAKTVIVDGILLFAIPEVEKQCDLKIFVDTNEDERFRRRLKRDVEERGRSAESVKNQFEKTVLPMHALFVEKYKEKADIVFRGGAYDAQGMLRLEEWIRSHE